MRRHCFPRKGWTSFCCISKLLPFDTVVRGVSVDVGGDAGVVVGVGVVISVADFVGFARFGGVGVTGIVDSGVFVFGLDGVGLIYIGVSLFCFDASGSGVGGVGDVSVVGV